MTAALLDTPADDATRRRLLAGGAALALGLAGCGSDPPERRSGARVEHRHGTTQVPPDPQRVVALGFTDRDYLLALGVVPVAVSTRGNGSEERFGVGSWALPKLGETAPKVLPYAEIDTEAVAALRPDLITGLTSGMSAQEYRALSKLAPTVAQPKGEPDYYAPWDVVTRLAGRALGQVGPAGELVANVEMRFARARRAHPAFDGETAVYAGVLGPREYYAESPSSSRVEILTALGFEIPAAIAKLAGEETYAEIRGERLDLLDGDVLVWELGSGVRRADIEADPLYEVLPVARDDRAVFVEDADLTAAMASISVLSLPLVVDRLVPMLAAAAPA